MARNPHIPNAFDVYTVVVLRRPDGAPDLPEAELDDLQARHLAYRFEPAERGVVCLSTVHGWVSGTRPSPEPAGSRRERPLRERGSGHSASGTSCRARTSTRADSAFAALVAHATAASWSAASITQKPPRYSFASTYGPSVSSGVSPVWSTVTAVDGVSYRTSVVRGEDDAASRCAPSRGPFDGSIRTPCLRRCSAPPTG